MPRIEVMNIKFNLDSSVFDVQVYAALGNIPRGKRSSVVKELLHAALCRGEAALLQIRDKSMPTVRRYKQDHAIVPEGRVGRPLPRAGPSTPITKTHSAKAEEGDAGETATISVKAVQIKEESKELDEFKSLIY